MKGNSAIFGIPAVLLCWCTVTLAVFAVENRDEFGPYNSSYYGFAPPSVWQSVQDLPVVGMFQPLYLLPAYLVLRRLGYNRAAKGLLWTTVTVFILSAALVIPYVLLVSSVPRVG
jgi:hypothetical protein